MKKKETSSTNSNTDYRAKIKNALRRQQRQFLVKLNQNTPMEKKRKRSNSTSKPKTATSSDNITQVMWHSLTPNAKKKIKLNVSNSSDPGMNEAFRRVIGVNLSNPINIRELSNPINIRESEVPPLQERIEQFFSNDYVSRVTPDARKTSNGLPIRYALGNYKTLHQKIFKYGRELFLSNIASCSSTLYKKGISIKFGYLPLCNVPQS